MDGAAKKTWMPTVGGIFDIVIGSLILSVLFLFVIGSLIIRLAESGIFDFNLSLLFMVMPAIIIGTLAIVGGVFAIQRRKWGWALAGSIAAALVPILLGIVSIILLVLSRNEFKQV
jgi:hypothetical protein